MKKYSTILLNIKTMETCCVSCKKNAATKNSSLRKTKPNRLMLLSNWALRGKKKLMFIMAVYRNELETACFSHDQAHSDNKDLDKRTILDKIGYR